MVNDWLGVIANAHLVFADRGELKAESPECLQLAELFSIAVDYPKTGIPAQIPQSLWVSEYPDFMEKPDKPSYESTQVIGKLYRQVKEVPSYAINEKGFTCDMATNSYDRDMEFGTFTNYVEDAFNCKRKYDTKQTNLMSHYGIKREVEIICGGILKLTNYSSEKRNTDDIAVAVKSLRKEARNWFDEGLALYQRPDNDKSKTSDIYEKASAWYYVTYHPSYRVKDSKEVRHPHLFSFAWVVHDVLLEIKQMKLQRRSLP